MLLSRSIMSPMPGKHRSHKQRLLPGVSGAAGGNGVAPPADVPRLEIRDLRLVIAIAEEGSLTLAGTRLNVTQPALSRHLKLLEGRLGTPLFARTGARLRLLPAGERLLRHAREVIDRVAHAERDVRESEHTAREVLRVGTECHTAYHWLPSILGRYGALHPRVDVEIAFEVARQPLKPLLAGALDVALLSEGYVGRGLAITRLFTDEFVAVVAPGHPWAGRAYVMPEDFSTARVLLLVPPRDSTVVRQFLEPAGVRPRQMVDVQLIGALSSLVAAQLGVGVLASWTIAPELRAGRLVAVRLGKEGLKRLWVAAVQRPRFKERAVQDFVRLLATSGPASGLDAIPASRA